MGSMHQTKVIKISYPKWWYLLTSKKKNVILKDFCKSLKSHVLSMLLTFGSPKSFFLICNVLIKNRIWIVIYMSKMKPTKT